MEISSEDQPVRQRIDVWRRRLIDLSYRNRLIKYRPTTATTLEIESPDIETLFADPGGGVPWNFYFPPEEEDEQDEQSEDAAAIVDQLVIRAAQVGRAPRANEIVVRGELGARRINRILDNLAKKSNAEFQDKALRILYLAAGFLDWVDPGREEALSSPLILVPVELRRETARHPYRMFFVDDEEIVINPSLTEKLHRDVKLELPESWIWEDKPVSLELNEIQEAIETTGWTVRRDSVLGLFSFQKFVMYRDLLDNEDLIAAHPVVRSLAEGKLGNELDQLEAEIPPLEELDEAQLPHEDFSILDADATQRRCIEAARQGQSYVMQGPPGTGKSQTIANVISDAIARGKRVLFVSEKAAALDVVHKRLAREGLDEFCLLLHGEHAARREVVEALNHSLTGSPLPRPAMSTHELDRLQQLRELLNNTAEIIHLPLPRLGDRSMREVLGELAHLYTAPGPAGAPPATDVKGTAVRKEFQQLDDVFQHVAERWNAAAKNFAWSGYAGDDFSVDDRGRVLSIVEALRSATVRVEQVSGQAASTLGLPAPANAAEADRFLELGRHLVTAPDLDERWLTKGAGIRVLDAVSEARRLFGQIAEHSRFLEDAYREHESIGPTILGALTDTLTALAAAAGETEGWETNLIGELPATRAFLARAQDLISEMDSAAQEAASLLGQPAERLTIYGIDELAKLAELTYRAEARPERSWLVRAGREAAEATFQQLRPLVEQYQRAHAEISQTYHEQALELDAPALHRRFKSEYTSAFSKLKTSYRRDARAIKEVRRDRKFPQTVVSDLEALASLQDLGRAIDALDSETERTLGAYSRGRQTDAARLERALEVARKATELTEKRSDLETLAGQLAVDATPSPRVAQLADELKMEIKELQEGIEQLSRVARKVGRVGSKTLAELKAELLSLRAAFEEFGAVVDDLDRGARVPAMDLETLRRRAEAVVSLDEAQEAVARRSANWADVLGIYFRAESSDWDKTEELGHWLVCLEEFVEGAPPSELRERLLQVDHRWPDFEDVQALESEFKAAVDAFAALFDEGRSEEIRGLASHQSFSELATSCRSLEAHVDDLTDWVEFKRLLTDAAKRGWAEFIAALAERETKAQDVVPAFRRAFWNRRLEAAFDEDPDLADRGTSYTRWIDEFRQVDRRLVRTAADRLIAARNSVRRAHIALPGGQVALLKREAAKRRKHIPVRILLSKISELVSDLKPCLMMSPLTVSHFLSPTQQFDLVVFDEASQVPPQDAINCIYRGKQLIVAGDSKQLPPTPFFQVSEAEETWTEDEEEQSEDMESILDSSEALLPRHPLQWHYRSRHEDLIAFSNEHVYGGMLRTFPAADTASSRKGVRFIHVEEGIYERGRAAVNRPEARAAAERVVSHLKSGRSSLGVIAFSVSQANAIAEELDRLRVLHPELEKHFSEDRLEGVFVKHLESVQGDERDVIVFSIGYGKGPDGRFLMNFGPLNKEGGFRRLNVAVTRARELVEIVSSVRSSDFSLSESASRGARLLREYIRAMRAVLMRFYWGLKQTATRTDPRPPLVTATAYAKRSCET